MRLIAAATTLFLLTLISVSDPGRVARAQSLDGQEIFRFDTFDDEQLWTDTLRLHEVVQTLTPAAALGLGLKVDVDALPPAVVNAITAGQLDVVGTTCALCHSTVDNSLAPGIGHRLDGWPNLDLDVGTIAASAPGFPDALREEFRNWGRGKYDPRHHIFDGTNLIVLNTPSLPVVIPPAYGLSGVGFETFTGDGPISYWNNYVAVTQMGGHGSFSDPRIGVTVTQTPDRVTPRLEALLAYQLSLTAPPPPAGSFDAIAAARGEALFNGAARCSTCHIPPTYTDVLSGPDPSMPFLHTAAEVGADPEYATRSATKLYRTTPLRALWQHPPYFHDGSASDLPAVVNHYDKELRLRLNAKERADLVEFLKSL
jgi:mono/diheme cytochrome c family protein